MPIHKMNLEGDLFIAKTTGYLDNTDARLWANALRNHAESNGNPKAAVIDMIEVNRLCPTVSKIMAEIVKTPNLRIIAVVVSDVMASQNDRVIAKLSEMSNVKIFVSHEEALRFARSRLSTSGNWGGMAFATASAASFHVGYAFAPALG